jgi:hypothetical protein
MSVVNGSMRGPVCVLGFGRSGTSLTMRLLHLLGVEIGPPEDLLAPGEADNPRGSWEPRWMVELNDEILDKLGTVWWHPLPAASGWERSPDFDELRERARGLLKEKFGAAPLWGWKDPRTTLTLPFWKDLVPDAKYVICLRNPADAISSIQRLPDPELSIGAWGDLWLEYTARALRETRGCPRALVFYEDFFRDAQGQVAAMASLLGLQPSDQSGLHRRLLEEIEQGMWHHATPPREMAATLGIPPAARIIFLALRTAEDARRAADGGHQQVSEAIERVAPELWWESRTSTDLRLAKARQTSALQDERRRLTKAVAQTNEEAAQLRTLIGQEREQYRSEMGNTCRELENICEELEGIRGELEDTRSELTVSAARHGEAQAALSELEDRLQRQETILEKMQSSISWRITVPLRATKRGVRRLRPIRRGSAAPARNQSLLAGLSVGQVWWFALLLTSIIAATDAILTHIVLITLLAAGPFFGLLTGRWARTAVVGVWAVALAVILGFPDGIWGTHIQVVDLGTVASVALLSTFVATLIERRLYHRSDDLQTPL